MRVVFSWMDGSLFFRGLTAFLGFLSRVAMGSFIVALFVGTEKSPDEKSAGQGLFARVFDKILNGFPKLIKMPSAWPSAVSNLASGSFFFRTLSDSLGTPVPAPKTGASAWAIPAWGLFAVPVWLMAAITFSAPLLPTMVLAVMLLPVLFFTFLSRSFEVNHLAVFLFLFVIINFVAGFMSFTPVISLQIAVLVSVLSLSAIVIPACCRTRESVDIFILAFLGGAGITGIVGIWQVFAGYVTQEHWIDQDAFTDIGLRVFSTLGNPNVYGSYLLLVIPVAAASVIYLKHPFLKILAAGLTGLLLLNLLLTYSRGCYLALAFAAGIFVLIMEKRFVVLFIPAVAALPFVLPASIINRFMSIINLGAGMDTSTAFRLNIWRGTTRMLRDFWASGVGQGIEAYNHIYPYYSFAAIPTPHSHNIYLQIAIELGVVGLLVFIAIMACYFGIMANFLRRVTELRLRIMAAAMISAVIAFLFFGIFDYVFYNYRVLLSFYILLGLAVAFVKANTPKESEPKSEGA